MDIWGDTKIDFLGKKKAAFIISSVMAFLGLAAVAAIPLGMANLGTDFSGGVAVQFRFEKPFEMDRAREVIAQGGFPDANLQEFAGTEKLLVKVKKTDTPLTEVTSSLGRILNSGMPDNPHIIERTTLVGPTVGKRLQADALLAIALALFGILLYIAWRFEWKFGVAAVVATFHDVLAVLAVLFIIDKEINLLIITALLTTAGYSLTDTVVVFDRIRENLRKRTKEELVPLINRSVNEVLRRTVVTSGTTLMVLTALLVRGGEVIHDFALTLFIGVLVGTYSSIFVASPLLLVWKKKSGKLIRH